MFKRESEQPVKVSFEEKKNNKEKRSLRERLSNIPVRRRVEAVLLAVVTVMASLSIDWSSLLASAASDPTIESGQSIYTVYEAAADNEKLKSAKISVKKPLNTDEVYYTWNVYQNLKDPSDPETGVKVGNGGSGTIKFLNNDFEDVTLSDDSTEQNKKLPDVVLLDDETAAVVFKLTSKDRSNITCKSFGTADSTYVKDKDGDWNGPISEKAIEYVPDSGNLTDVDLSIVPDTLGLSAGQSYTFSDIKLTPAYQRKLTFSSDSTLISNANENDPTFKVTDDATKNGTAKVTVGGEGVDSKDVTVNVVSFALKGTVDNNPYVFPYKGSGYNAADLYIATCNNEINNITTYFETTFVEGNLTEGLPQDPGSYTMTITGKGIYKNLSCTKTFTIAQGELTQGTFDGTATVKNGKIDSITGAKFITGSGKKIDLVYGTDFDAAVTATIPGANEVTYTITITGKGNFKNGDTAPTLTAAETSGVRLDSVIDHIGFKDQTGDYNGGAQTPAIVFYDSNNNAIENPAFTYEVKYNGTERSTGTEVKDVPSIINAGEYTATVTGTGIYEGFFDTKDNTTPNGRTYVLKPISFTTLAGLKVTLEKENFEESDSFVIKVKDVTYNDSGTKTLAEGTYVLKDDYSKNVGTHNVTVLGCGNYEGEATAQYTVFPSLPTCATFKLKGEDGKWMSGTLTADDTTEEWNYVWTSDSAYYTYRGNAIEPLDNDISAKVNGDTLYVSSGLNPMTRDPGVNNINVTSSNDKAYFILTLPEKYASKRIKVEFEIKPAQLNALSFTSNLKNRSYTGSEIELKDDEFKVTDKNVKELTKGIDYIVTYENNENAGTATITATGTGNYTGTATNKFTINKIEINAANVDITINDQQLNISGKTVITDMDDVEITMTMPDELGHDKVIRFSSEDFTLSNYANNEHAWIDGDTAADQPQVTITGKRNLTGSKDVKFEILNKTLTGLTWKLAVSGDSYEGVLGSPGTTINLSDPKYGYVVDYAPSLPAAFIKIYDSNGKKMNPGNYTYVETPSEAEGKNTITIVGKGDYRGGEYYFTYDVRKRDINDCVFKQETDGSSNVLPTYTLKDRGNDLTKDTDYETDFDTVMAVPAKCGDDYEVTFKGKGSYTGEKKVKFHIGTPFNSEHVFVTMYGPNGTGTVGSENRLTYFGDNDPYFILTSDKTDNSKKIEGPTYAGGIYKADTGDYNIDFEPIDSDERHKVGTTVKVTFTAKEGNGVWYNPGNEGITYYYKVMPGVGASAEPYPNLQSYLSIYTEYSGATPGKSKSFPTTVTNNLITFSDFKFPYTTEGIDPEIYICYDPKIEKGARATQCSSGVPEAPTGGEGFYAAPVKVKFNDSSLFTVSKGLISANDTDRKIIMTPVRTGWLGASQNPPKIEVDYTFTAAKLSDADITFTPSENYTYSGSPADVDFNVTIGKTTKSLLTPGVDYQVLGYGAYSGDEFTDEKIKTIKDAVNASTGAINTVLKNLDISLSKDKPESVGKYVLVIGPATNNNYTGYNIAKFSITKDTIGSIEFRNPEYFVTYKGAGTDTPSASELIVKGENGRELEATDYTIEIEEGKKPNDAAVVWAKGVGNYSGSKFLTYPVKADISPASGSDYDFSKANLSLESHTTDSNCLKLTLKNDGDYPLIGSTDKIFNPSTLTLEDKKGVKIPSTYLTTTVTGIDSEDNLTTVGKKKITVSGAAGKPVTGTREYYVKVFADLSTAVLTLKVGGKEYPGNQIPYTGAAIAVVPDVTFRGIPVNRNCYTIKEDNYTDIGSYTIEVTGTEDGAGAYYKGTAKKPYSIVYDLENDVEVVYTKDGTNWDTLAGKSLTYIGKSIVDHLDKQNWIKVRMTKTGADVPRSDYSLKHENDIEPGAGTASVIIDPVSTSSINRQTVYFSIGGTELEEGEKCSVTLNPNNPVYTYDGTAKEPEVSITYDQTKLTRGKDFEIEYLNNVNVPPENAAESQMPTVKIYGINGRYTGMITKTFEIKKKELTDSDVKVVFDDVPFGGRKSATELYPSNPNIAVTIGERTLVAGTDYKIIYGDNESITAGEYFTKNPETEYKITITGIGNYCESVKKKAKQLSGTLNSPNVVIDKLTSVYNGKKAFSNGDPVIKNGECVLEKGKDYEISDISNIINEGSYTITIKALPNSDYYDNGSSKTFTYTVTPRSVEENSGEFSLTLYDPVTGNSANSFAWNNNTQIKPKVRLMDSQITGHDPSVGDIWTDVDSLKQSIMMNSFNVTYGDNRFAGKDAGSVTLTASGNYKGSITRTFSIGTDISNATLSYDKTSAEYDGTPKKQDITVRYNNNTLEAGVAYESPITYTYTDSKGNVQETTSPSAVGTYVPVIKGKTDGGYYGDLKGSPFRIIAQNKTGNIKIKFNGIGGEVDAADYVCHYNTKKQEPSISVYDTSGGTDVALTKDVDYTVSYGNNTNAGSGYVYVALEGNYTGTAQEIFTIQPYDISNATLEFEGENYGIIKNVPEASFPYSPLFKLKGTDDDGKPFEISYADSRQKQDLSVPDSSKVKKPGKGSLAVSGTGNNLYGTTNAYDYEVYGRLSEKNVIVTPPINTGVKKDPDVKVVFAGETLVLDTDYSLRIVPFDQTVSGGGNVIVEGLGYFTGSVYTKYGEASDVSSLTLRGFSQQYIYSGVFAGPQESAIYAVDKDGNTVISADKLECTFTSDKDNAACITANATVTITTKATLEDGTVQDGPKATYKIVPRNINSCDIMRLENDIYTGKALKPPVAVSFRRKEYTFGSTGGIAEEKVLDVITLKEGTDYSLSYKNNVYPGTADITVTGKGNYTGTRLFHFVINVISMGSVNARRTSDGIVVSWGARPYVAGYRVLYDTEKLTAVSTTGTTVTLKDALPTRVGVQAYILGSDKKPIYGAPKYIDVS